MSDLDRALKREIKENPWMTHKIPKYKNDAEFYAMMNRRARANSLSVEERERKNDEAAEERYRQTSDKSYMKKLRARERQRKRRAGLKGGSGSGPRQGLSSFAEFERETNKKYKKWLGSEVNKKAQTAERRRRQRELRSQYGGMTMKQIKEYQREVEEAQREAERMGHPRRREPEGMDELRRLVSMADRKELAGKSEGTGTTGGKKRGRRSKTARREAGL